ncbi:MAG: DUF2764 family protein [Paludibacteraceae bacterium]|nr:DUF2764 family protein [Paludibacteraceae bacterium]
MGYECLLAGLPDLKAGADTPIKLEDLLTMLDEMMKPCDKKLLTQLRMTTSDPVIDALIARYDDEDVPESVKPEWWTTARTVLSDADIRAMLLYEQGLQSKNRFVRAWFAFNQDMNNILVAQICRKHGFDVKKMIVGHNDVAETLRTHTSQKDFGLSEVMDNFQEILALASIDNLMEREKRMDALRFEWLQEKTYFDVFSKEQVLAYYLQVEMLHRWSLLTVEQGERVFREMVADMKKGIDLSNA